MAILPNASESTKRRNPHLYPRAGTSPQLQEQEADRDKPKDRKTVPSHGIQDKEMDAWRDKEYRISVTFLVSDKRRRDNPGMLETVCDAIIAAGRHLAGIEDRKRTH